MMDSKCWLTVLCLCLCSSGTTSSTGCQPVGSCGCENSGAAVDLAELDGYLVSRSQSLQPGNSTVQYYLQLCSPLRLDGDCSESSNSTVCSVNGTIYTSYGRADTASYRVDEASKTVNVMFNSGDPVSGVFRQVDITIFCGSTAEQTRTIINAANDTFLDVTIFTNLQCVTAAEDSTSNTSPSLVQTSGTQTSVVMPTNSVSTSSTLLPATVSVQPSLAASASTAMTSPDVPTPMLPSSSVSMAVEPSLGPSMTSPEGPMSSPAQPSSGMISGTVASPSLLPSPSQTQSRSSTQSPQPGSSPPPSQSQTQPSTHSAAPVLHSSSAVPSCPPQQSCESCTKKLALSLGVAIPSTAVVTFIITLLFTVCCHKARKGRKYIRLAPTVYFDEEDND